jgi:hypothetical protein
LELQLSLVIFEAEAISAQLQLGVLCPGRLVTSLRQLSLQVRNFFSNRLLGPLIGLGQKRCSFVVESFADFLIDRLPRRFQLALAVSQLPSLDGKFGVFFAGGFIELASQGFANLRGKRFGHSDLGAAAGTENCVGHDCLGEIVIGVELFHQ